jgi:hypothetical protein
MLTTKELWRQICRTIVSILPKPWNLGPSYCIEHRAAAYKNKAVLVLYGIYIKTFCCYSEKGPTWWFYSRTLRPCRRVGGWGLSGSTGSAPWSQEAAGSQSHDTGSLKQEYTVKELLLEGAIIARYSRSCLADLLDSSYRRCSPPPPPSYWSADSPGSLCWRSIAELPGRFDWKRHSCSLQSNWQLIYLADFQKITQMLSAKRLISADLSGSFCWRWHSCSVPSKAGQS